MAKFKKIIRKAPKALKNVTKGALKLTVAVPIVIIGSAVYSLIAVPFVLHDVGSNTTIDLPFSDALLTPFCVLIGSILSL